MPAEGVELIFEGAEASKRDAAAEKARKAAKASRDKQAGRRAAEEALQEGTSGDHQLCLLHIMLKLLCRCCCC